MIAAGAMVVADASGQQLQTPPPTLGAASLAATVRQQLLRLSAATSVEHNGGIGIGIVDDADNDNDDEIISGCQSGRPDRDRRRRQRVWPQQRQPKEQQQQCTAEVSPKCIYLFETSV